MVPSFTHTPPAWQFYGKLTSWFLHNPPDRGKNYKYITSFTKILKKKLKEKLCPTMEKYLLLLTYCTVSPYFITCSNIFQLLQILWPTPECRSSLSPVPTIAYHHISCPLKHPLHQNNLLSGLSHCDGEIFNRSFVFGVFWLLWAADTNVKNPVGGMAQSHAVTTCVFALT